LNIDDYDMLTVEQAHFWMKQKIAVLLCRSKINAQMIHLVHAFWFLSSGVRRKFSWGGVIQWHRVVICIWYALFVTSQNDVIFLFPNQRFGEVC